ncbi:MAG: hypothetical protein ACOYBR_00715 [Fluviibacter sp.]
MNTKHGQDRLLRIADILERTRYKPIQKEATSDLLWLANALKSIAAGGSVDIASELGIKATRGERTNRAKSKARRNRDKLVLAWLYAAMATENCDGLGLTLEEACALAAEGLPFGITEETIRSYWGKLQKLREEIKKSYGFFSLED